MISITIWKIRSSAFVSFIWISELNTGHKYFSIYRNLTNAVILMENKRYVLASKQGGKNVPTYIWSIRQFYNTGLWNQNKCLIY